MVRVYVLNGRIKKTAQRGYAPLRGQYLRSNKTNRPIFSSGQLF